MQILQASKGDFSGAVAGLLGHQSDHNNSTSAGKGGAGERSGNNNHYDSLMQDDTYFHNVNFSASASVNERN